MHEACGGRDGVGVARRLWFEHSAARLECDPGVALFPAEMVAIAARDLRAVDLWWDLSPCRHLVDSFIEAVVMPPMRLNWWDRLRLTSLSFPRLGILAAFLKIVLAAHSVTQLQAASENIGETSGQ